MPALSLTIARHPRRRASLVLAAWIVGAFTATNASARSLEITCAPSGAPATARCALRERSLLHDRRATFAATDIRFARSLGAGSNAGERLWLSTAHDGDWYSPAIGKSHPTGPDVRALEDVRTGVASAASISIGYDRRLVFGFAVLWVAVGVIVTSLMHRRTRLDLECEGDALRVRVGGGESLTLRRGQRVEVRVAEMGRQRRLALVSDEGKRTWLEPTWGSGERSRARAANELRRFLTDNGVPVR